MLAVYVVLLFLNFVPPSIEITVKPCPCGPNEKCLMDHCVPAPVCPEAAKFGPGPPEECEEMKDPNNLPPSPMEKWLTREVFEDLFPKANIGWGPHYCFPYNYDAFVIAARYFQQFGATHDPRNGYTREENYRRDVAAFFAHAVQETGENDASLYEQGLSVDDAHSCFYRGGFFNWFEGGPNSLFLRKESPGYLPEDGDECNQQGRYCAESTELNYWFPCNQTDWFEDNDKGESKKWFSGCYFGRGAIQISYNYNYGQFDLWLKRHRIYVDLLNYPNKVMTHREPPLAVLASLWFYMTPQPPKPAMHDIVMGTWEPGKANRAAGYSGAMFGPTSLVINNECNGEDPHEPGGPGESRRIKAYKWFAKYFGMRIGEDRTLSCKGMPVLLERIEHHLSYQPDWSTTWKEQPCDCAPAKYGGMIPYFQENYYPNHFVEDNGLNRIRCVLSMYDDPGIYGMSNETSTCLNTQLPLSFRAQQFDPATSEEAGSVIDNRIHLGPGKGRTKDSPF